MGILSQTRCGFLVVHWKHDWIRLSLRHVKRYRSDTSRDTTLVLEDTRENMLSLVVPLKAGFKVNFATCKSDDPTFGGYLITPNASHTTLVFENNLWRVVLWSHHHYPQSWQNQHLQHTTCCQAYESSLGLQFVCLKRALPMLTRLFQLSEMLCSNLAFLMLCSNVSFLIVK